MTTVMIKKGDDNDDQNDFDDNNNCQDQVAHNQEAADDDDHHDDENNDANESNDANYQDTVAHNWRLVIQSAQERDTASYLCQVIKVVMMINLMMMMINQPGENGLPAYSHLVGKCHDDEGREHDTVYTKLQAARELPDQDEQGGQDD